jgi:hypothetical protein
MGLSNYKKKYKHAKLCPTDLTALDVYIRPVPF